MFGINPVKGCSCGACDQLRHVSIGARIGQGAAVLVMVALGLGGASLVLSLLVWGVVAVVRQL
jgi:hypothetical protein